MVSNFYIATTSLPVLPRIDRMKSSLKSIPEQEDCTHLTMASAPAATTTETLDYLSNLKAFLTALVILHHTAIAYGGAGQLIYQSPSHPPGSEALLISFNALNQTFFMALFFFIAGFLSCRSLGRRMERDGSAGVRIFLRDRVWRLGMPTVIYSLIGPAFCRLIIALARGEDLTWAKVWVDLSSAPGVKGPVWFCALLLLFDVLLAAAYMLKGTMFDRRIALAEEGSELGAVSINSTKLVASLFALTLADFLWRLFFPVSAIFTPLNLNLGYLPQYIAAYTFGTTIPSPTYAIPSPKTLIALAATSAVTSVVLTSSMSSRLDLEDSPDPTAGGLTTIAATYAIWNNFTGYLIASGLLRLFPNYINMPYAGITSLAYLAFLIHIPISTIVELSLESWQGGPAVKFTVVGTVNVLASWAAAWVGKVGLAAIEESIAGIPSAAHRSRSRTFSRGERAIEILEGLDEVGR